LSLYRQPGQTRRRRRLALAVGRSPRLLVAVVVGLTLPLLLAPTRAERLAGARSAASEALDGLELLGHEYGQAVRGGRVVAPTEYAAAKADVARARAAVASHADDIDASDPAAPREVAAALARPTGAPVLLIERVAFTYAEEPAELRRSWCDTRDYHYRNRITR